MAAGGKYGSLCYDPNGDSLVITDKAPSQMAVDAMVSGLSNHPLSDSLLTALKTTPVCTSEAKENRQGRIPNLKNRVPGFTPFTP